MKVTITSNVETVNNTFTIHQIDLNDMIHNGECENDDEIIFKVDGENVSVSFVNGNHIIEPGADKQLANAIVRHRDALEIYQ